MEFEASSFATAALARAEAGHSARCHVCKKCRLNSTVLHLYVCLQMHLQIRMIGKGVMAGERDEGLLACVRVLVNLKEVFAR